MHDYVKSRIAIKYWMIAKAEDSSEYDVAVRAFEFAMNLHDGTRKDGVTPEFAHQVSQANFLRTLARSLMHPAETLATVFLHDVSEDKDVPIAALRDMFGGMVADATELMTNRHPNGEKKNKASYYAAMAASPIASICKAADRMHNLQSMPGVFGLAKMEAYAQEVPDLLLPMLREARRNFPRQEAAYENLKHVLQSQVEFVRIVVENAKQS